MIQFTDQNYADIMDSLGAVRHILMPAYGQPPEQHIIARARHLLSRVEDMLQDGTIVQEEQHG